MTTTILAGRCRVFHQWVHGERFIDADGFLGRVKTCARCAQTRIRLDRPPTTARLLAIALVQAAEREAVSR